MSPDQKAAAEARNMALFFLAAFFHGAAVAGEKASTAESSLDEAERFLKAAEARGINPGRFG